MSSAPSLQQQQLAALIAKSAGMAQGIGTAQAPAAANAALLANLLRNLQQQAAKAPLTPAMQADATAQRLATSAGPGAPSVPPSAIPAPLLESVSGKARIRAMAALLDPDIQLDDAVVELVDAMMGKFVEDVTTAACSVARARAVASSTAFLTGGSDDPARGLDASLTAQDTQVVLQVSDLQAVVSDAYPYLAVPTASIAAAMAPRPPPSGVMTAYLHKAGVAPLTGVGGGGGPGGAGTAAGPAHAGGRGEAGEGGGSAGVAAAATTAGGAGGGSSKAAAERREKSDRVRVTHTPGYENGIPLVPTATKEAVERAMRETEGSANAGLPLAGTSYIQVLGPDGEVVLRKRRGRPPTKGEGGGGDYDRYDRPAPRVEKKVPKAAITPGAAAAAHIAAVAAQPAAPSPFTGAGASFSGSSSSGAGAGAGGTKLKLSLGGARPALGLGSSGGSAFL